MVEFSEIQINAFNSLDNKICCKVRENDEAFGIV